GRVRRRGTDRVPPCRVRRHGRRPRRRPAEIRIGDSVVLVTAAGDREVFPAFLYVYVADADAVYERALAAGATSLEEPFDTPTAIGGRWCGTPSGTSGRSDTLPGQGEAGLGRAPGESGPGPRGTGRPPAPVRPRAPRPP